MSRFFSLPNLLKSMAEAVALSKKEKDTVAEMLNAEG